MIEFFRAYGEFCRDDPNLAFSSTMLFIFWVVVVIIVIIGLYDPDDERRF